MSGPLELVAEGPEKTSRLSPAAISKATATLGHGAWTVFRFEFRRSRTPSRLLIWLGVLLAPVGIFWLMRKTGEELPQAAWVYSIFALVVEMIVLLNALLWVAPLVQSELETKTWLYIVVRPFGRLSLVLGKGLNGLVWTMGAGLFSLLLTIIVASGGEYTILKRILPSNNGLIDVPRIAVILGALTVLSSTVYSSLFSAIGCIAPRRAMLVAFSYTLIAEVLISFIPAIVSRLTVQYHLRCLLTDWAGFEISAEGRHFLFSEWHPASHVAALLAMAVFWQVVAMTIVHIRQYVLSDEN